MSSSLAAYDRIRSTCAGRTEVSPRRVLTRTGKKHRTPAVAIRGAGESGSNQALKIGENAMIGMAFAAIAIGIRASPSRRNRASTIATTIPKPEPIANPPRASFSVSQPALASAERCVQKAETIAPGFGRRNFWMLKAWIESCQTTIASRKTTIAGTQSASFVRTVVTTVPRGVGCATTVIPSPPRARSRVRRRPRLGAARALR